MFFRLFRKTKSGGPVITAAASASPVEMSASVAEDSAAAIVQERSYNHWLDEAYRECRQNGGFEGLEGLGKPIVVKGGDPLNGILKNAHVLPQWLELQHEIRDELRAMKEAVEHGRGEPSDGDIEAINRKIVKYNRSVPTSLLQKGKIRKETLLEQYERWV